MYHVLCFFLYYCTSHLTPRAANEEEGFNYETDDILDARIADGLFKNMKAEMNMYNDTNFGFGFMRGAWNLNPSKKVSFLSAVVSF